MLRIGIDVGGTHTDAVLLDGQTVVSSTKALTSADVLSGILEALENLLANFSGSEDQIAAIMLGTTQFTNAVVERQQLAEVAAIRIGLPSGSGLPPKAGWPEDIANALGDHGYMINGGYLYDGWPLAPLDERQMDAVVADLVQKKLEAVAITSVFSPMNAQPEQLLARKIRAALPHARITQSHEIGRLGILERENAALLNAALLAFADRVVEAFVAAVRQRGLRCRFYVSQNDGTLMDAEFARRFPALTFASGPTNSIRGACWLTGLTDAIVVDIGGTTSDIGILQDGFPRESNVVIEVGGVRTNFRMPDILALGLGGGSIVSADGLSVGPRSVGHRLLEQALVFGGETLTATDIVVAAGHARIGQPERCRQLPAAVLGNAQACMARILDEGIDKMKPSSEPLPVVLVGGGALLATEPLTTASAVHQPQHAGVANAIGAAIAQIGGEAEQLVAYSQQPRDQAIAEVTQAATAIAVNAGADPASIRVADVEETALSYVTDNSTRLRVKVVGDIAGLSQSESAQA